MIAPGQAIDAARAALAATSPVEILAVALSLLSSLQEIARSRWCWITGGAGAALLAWLAFANRLPMQAALETFFVAMSGYGWWQWQRRSSRAGRLVIGAWPWPAHVLACLALVVLSGLSAHWLAAVARESWPFLDSLTTLGSLLATWLMARAKLENWLYWLAVDALQGYLFGVQGLYFVALLQLVYLGISVVGFVRWLKVHRSVAAI